MVQPKNWEINSKCGIWIFASAKPPYPLELPNQHCLHQHVAWIAQHCCSRTNTTPKSIVQPVINGWSWRYRMRVTQKPRALRVQKHWSGERPQLTADKTTIIRIFNVEWFRIRWTLTQLICQTWTDNFYFKSSISRNQRHMWVVQIAEPTSIPKRHNTKPVLFALSMSRLQRNLLSNSTLLQT